MEYQCAFPCRLRCGFGDYLLLLPALVFSSYGIPLLLIALFVVTSIEVALLYLAGWCGTVFVPRACFCASVSRTVSA